MVGVRVQQAERPACFGDADLTFRGWTWDDQGAYDCHAAGTDPSWLVCSMAHVRLTTLPYEAGEPDGITVDPADGPLRVAVDPSSTAARALRPNRWVEVTGRFGDPVTAACDELGSGFREECQATVVVSDARELEFPEVLPPEAWAIVAVDELRVRSEPRLASPPVDALGAGDRIYIGVGPFAVDGQWWYSVNYGSDFLTARRAGWPRTGFVAAGEAESPYLEVAPVACDDPAPDLESILALTPYERATCLGGRELTLEGHLMPPELGPEGTCMFMGEIPAWEPRWLTLGCGALQLSAASAPFDQLALHAVPDIARSMVAVGEGRVRVDGHFNDPASSECQDRSRPPVLWGVFYPPVDDDALVLRCRASFVTTHVEPIAD